MGTLRLITDDERRARLALRHRLALSTAAGSVADVARSVVALHSSDPVSVYLSALRRMRSPSIEAVGRALHDERSVVRHHAMRRTLWVCTPDLAPTLHAACTLALVQPDRRRVGQWLVTSGVAANRDAAERWIDDGIDELLAEIDARGETTARELGDALPHLTAGLGVALDKPYGTTVAAHTRLLTLMGLMGSIVRSRPIGTWISSQYRWATTERWLGAPWPDIPEADAQATLVGAYLRAFGPATTADVQWWTGLPKGTTTRALADAGAQAVRLADGNRAWLDSDDDAAQDDAASAAEPWVALLPSLDPTTMGWKQRDWFLPPGLVPALFDTNGNAGPTIWVDGRIVGGWAQRGDGTIATHTLAQVANWQLRALDGEAERLRALLGDARFRHRFPSPLSRELAG